MKPPEGSLEEWARNRHLHGGVDEIPTSGPGALFLAGKHYVGPDPESALTAISATKVICLVERFELERRYDDYLVFLENDDRAIWWPVMDFQAPDVAKAANMVKELSFLLSAGENVLVHCGAGIGRAGTLAAAVLVYQGVEVSTALQRVRAARPMAGPQSDAQEALLHELFEYVATPPQ